MPETNGFANPEALVTTEWAAEHGRDQGVRLVEVDVDTSAYERGHIEGAVAWDWRHRCRATITSKTTPIIRCMTVLLWIWASAK